VNALSTKDLRNLFKLRADTPSDTHDKLQCERCKTVKDDADEKEKRVLPFKLAKCAELLETIMADENAEKFLTPLIPTNEGVSESEYDSLVKQPMDFSRIKAQLEKVDEKTGQPFYKSAGEFSKDVNRIFGNVAKVWNVDTEIGLAASMLQSIWVQRWTQTVPVLMSMKPPPKDVTSPSPNTVVCQEIPEGTTSAVKEEELIKVERGDNYQEQIGMPEEEDMRNWSHHFNTDTCDDPIFRAAMKGYDTVSFVFGLEVTWDLITARKQEEEEQRALDELATLEEAMKANEDSDNSDDDGVEKPMVVCDVKGGEKSEKRAKAKREKKKRSADYEDSNDEGDDGPNDMGDFLVDDDEEEEGDFEGEDDEEGGDEEEEEEEEEGEEEEEEERDIVEEKEEEVVEEEEEEEEEEVMDVEMDDEKEDDFEMKPEVTGDKNKRKKKMKEERRERKRKKKEAKEAQKLKKKKKKIINDEEEDEDDTMFEVIEEVVPTEAKKKNIVNRMIDDDLHDEEEEEEEIVMEEPPEEAVTNTEVSPPATSKPPRPPTKSVDVLLRLSPPGSSKRKESLSPARKRDGKVKIQVNLSQGMKGQDEVEKTINEPVPEPMAQAPPSPKAAPLPRLSLGSTSASTYSTSEGFEIVIGETKCIKKFGGFGEHEGVVTGNGEEEATFEVHFEGLEEMTIMTEKQLNAAIKKYQKKHAAPTGWECGVCTYVNNKGRKKCEMCTAPAPKASKPKGRRSDKENTTLSVN
jgi:hypothetical protein